MTEQVARDLSELALRLEAPGRDPETVSHFLLQCACALFADHLRFTPTSPFGDALDGTGLRSSSDFQCALPDHREGAPASRHFDRVVSEVGGTLALERSDLAMLGSIAHADWKCVEPSILGMLVTRALDPKERHRRGVEYTPRAFVERLIQPAVVEPIRERWTEVQRKVRSLSARAGTSARDRNAAAKKALTRLHRFHRWLCSLRILDPACGSGDILYVTLQAMMDIEREVLRTIQEVADPAEMPVAGVGPWQFHGIELDSLSAEVAAVTLRVAYYQSSRSISGIAASLPQHLAGTQTIECRDAVLTYGNVAGAPGTDWPDQESGGGRRHEDITVPGARDRCRGPGELPSAYVFGIARSAYDPAWRSTSRLGRSVQNPDSVHPHTFDPFRNGVRILWSCTVGDPGRVEQN
jgi:hypothetical protein